LSILIKKSTYLNKNNLNPCSKIFFHDSNFDSSSNKRLIPKKNKKQKQKEKWQLVSGSQEPEPPDLTLQAGYRHNTNFSGEKPAGSMKTCTVL
jgi:hypothetical protein